RNRIYLDEDALAEEAAHLNRRARGRILRVDELITNVAHNLNLGNVHDEIVELDDRVEIGADRFQRRLEIGENLLRLGAQVAGTDEIARGIERHLPGDIEGRARRRLDDMGIADGARQRG